MGAGFALEVQQRFPNLRQELAGYILEKCKSEGLYGVVRSCYNNLGAFQTKTRYDWTSKLDIIEFSVNALIREMDIFELKNVHLNFPGIGFGKLTREEVMPVISKLPDSVTIWYL